MDNWFKNKDHEKWLAKYNTKFNVKEIDVILNSQHEWCNTNNFNFTPCLFINGFEYPNVYDISDLPFYIDEMLDDKNMKLAETEKLK